MQDLRRTLPILMAVLAGSTLAAEPELRISVLVYNHARLDQETLRRAKAEATRIYRHAGVEIQWADCPVKPEELHLYPACPKFLDKGDYVLRVLSPRMERTIPKGAFGRTWFSGDGTVGYVAAICPERAEELSGEINGSFPRLLGHLIAHELGHLLLGIESHAPNGLMHAPWFPEELALIKQGWLLFDTQKAEQIRERLRQSGEMAPGHSEN